MKLFSLFPAILLLLFALTCSKNNPDETALPNGKLGTYAQISISVTSIENSLSFYRRLGFQKTDGRETGNNPWVLLSDGDISVVLSGNRFPSPALTYFSSNLEQTAKDLRTKGVQLTEIRNDKQKLSSTVLADPNDFGITLINFASGRIPKPDGIPRAICGRYGEITIPTTDLDQSLAFWQKVGFALKQRNQLPFPRATVSDGMATIGIEQDGLSPSVALTYHVEDLPACIGKLKEAGIGIDREIVDDNGNAYFITLRDPDGQLIIVRGKTM